MPGIHPAFRIEHRGYSIEGPASNGKAVAGTKATESVKIIGTRSAGVLGTYRGIIKRVRYKLPGTNTENKAARDKGIKEAKRIIDEVLNIRCHFSRAYIGQCTETVVAGKKYCKAHAAVVCAGCGKQASHDCPETFQFMCGAPLCDTCQHLGPGHMHSHGPKPPPPPPAPSEHQLAYRRIVDKSESNQQLLAEVARVGYGYGPLGSSKYEGLGQLAAAGYLYSWQGVYYLTDAGRLRLEQKPTA